MYVCMQASMYVHIYIIIEFVCVRVQSMLYALTKFFVAFAFAVFVFLQLQNYIQFQFQSSNKTVDR